MKSFLKRHLLSKVFKSVLLNSYGGSIFIWTCMFSLKTRVDILNVQETLILILKTILIMVLNKFNVIKYQKLLEYPVKMTKKDFFAMSKI